MNQQKNTTSYQLGDKTLSKYLYQYQIIKNKTLKKQQNNIAQNAYRVHNQEETKTQITVLQTSKRKKQLIEGDQIIKNNPKTTK